MSMPFWQYPHCGTCVSIHACCSGCSAGTVAPVVEADVVPRDFAHAAGSPSSVVIALPLTAATGVTHERISLPSSSTEQAPHCARPQPKRGPCRWSSLCKTYSSGVSRLAVTLCTRPFTLILSLLAMILLGAKGSGLAAPEGASPAPGQQSIDHRQHPARTRSRCPQTLSPGRTTG